MVEPDIKRCKRIRIVSHLERDEGVYKRIKVITTDDYYQSKVYVVSSDEPFDEKVRIAGSRDYSYETVKIVNFDHLTKYIKREILTGSAYPKCPYYWYVYMDPITSLKPIQCRNCYRFFME